MTKETVQEWCLKCGDWTDHEIVLRVPSGGFNEIRCVTCGFNNIDTAARMLAGRKLREQEEVEE